jgi:hypothetical protein
MAQRLQIFSRQPRAAILERRDMIYLRRGRCSAFRLEASPT